MPRADGTYFNAWDRAKATGEVWLSASEGAAYRNGEYAPWRLHGPAANPFTREPGEKDDSWGANRWPGGAHVFVSFDDAATWAKEHLGITGWKRWKYGDYFPDPNGTDVACKGPGGWHKTCSNKRKPDSEFCGVHQGVLARDEARRVRSQQLRVKYDRNRALDSDIKEAAERLEIPATASGGRASIHAEDFLALCRELTELRALREFA